MKPVDIEDFKEPSRKPWLIAVVVIIAALAFVFRDEYRSEDLPQSPVAPAKIAESRTEAPAASVVVSTNKGVVARPPVVDLKKRLSELKQLESQKKLVEARSGYLGILGMAGLSDDIRKEVENRIGGINIVLAMSPYLTPEKVEYIVQRGDSVDKIARKFGTTVELITQGNKLKNPNLIKQGDRMVVFTGKFSLKVSKTNIDMVIYMNDMFFKRYSVCTGKYGKTPAGTFVISDKIKEPVWWRPDGQSVPFGNPENILGTHWLTLKAVGETPSVSGYGIHGTWEPETVGKAESAGCVRMRNEEVEELFTLVPVGTSVVIVE